MPNPILITKLHPPPLREQHVQRGSLLEQLEECTKRRLTLVSAPAGYGKTTLLTSWYYTTHKDVAWFSLDEADNDLSRFLTYLVATLQRVDETLQEVIIPIDDTTYALTFILNDIADNEDHLILLLDDYHLIHNPEVHASVQFLLDHAPPTFHLLIGSRADPPLALSRLRVRRDLSEFRMDELRFDLPEARSFLQEVMDLTLSDKDLRELEHRTEGWVAGLQLAALSLQGRAEVSGFIETFTGTDRYVLDYLTEEVLMRQSDDMQNFLMLTSVLERLHGPLCDHVTGMTGSQERLELLERDNLFIVPLDSQRQWYRLHAFFGDLLLHRLKQARPDLVPQLRTKASSWFEGHGDTAEALRHALLAHDYPRAARLIDNHPRHQEIRQELLALLRTPRSTATLAELLEQSSAQGVRLEQIRSLYAGLEPLAAHAVPSSGGDEFIEPLSERELDVLRLMTGGLSNKAIAKQLDISLNTVKTHTKNINGKLVVSSRLQAVVKAQELGLV